MRIPTELTTDSEDVFHPPEHIPFSSLAKSDQGVRFPMRNNGNGTFTEVGAPFPPTVF